jgi:predicted PurR-regulated permease PerM
METNSSKFNLEISTNTIVKVLIILFLIWFLYLIKDVVVILFVSLILVSILEPAVDWLKLKGIPKILGVVMIYLVLVAFLALIIGLIIPPIGAQIDQLSESFPVYWSQISTDFSITASFLDKYGIYQSLKSAFQSLNFSQATSGIFSRLQDFVLGLVSFLVILVITFYMLVQENAMKRVLKSIVPVKYLPYAYQVFSRIQKKLGGWLRGELLLAFAIFLVVYIGLLVIGLFFGTVKYALILAILAGLFEFVPYLGPIFSGLIAVFLTFFQSPIKALFVLILFILVHPLENHIIVPQVMKKTIGLNPIISIVALLVGAQVGGFLGVILAIPIVTALSVFVQDFLDKKRESDLTLEE